MKILLFLLLSICFSTFSQSKKEQIDILNNRVDSLNKLINTERSSNAIKISDLNTTIINLESKISTFNLDISKLTSELQNTESKIRDNQEEITTLQIQLNEKTDSLVLLKLELEKLKPESKPVVTSPPVVIKNGTSNNQTQTGKNNFVTIGTQTWMTMNLDVSTFRNGDPIPQAKSSLEWDNARKNEQPAWCYYDNKIVENGTKFGKLYNWYAVNDPRGLAPAGYHIPTDAEWTVLTDYLGGESVAGKKMKSKGGWASYTTGNYKTCPKCENWNTEYRRKTACNTCKDTRTVPAQSVTHSGNGTNSSGFCGLPGGNFGYTDFVGKVVTGGVLLIPMITLQLWPGSAICIPSEAKSIEDLPQSHMGSLFVASGINILNKSNIVDIF